MPYQPFLIADMQTGKHIGQDPWILPMDAYPVLTNAQVRKGKLEVRHTVSSFAQMLHGSVPASGPIMGIFNHMFNGKETTLIFDTRRVCEYDPADESVTDIVAADTFNGDRKDFFSFVTWLNRSYFVNNKDQVYQYDGETVSVFNIQFSTPGPTNQLQTARFIFILKDRLCFLNVVENGDWRPNRLRYGPTLGTDFTNAEAGYIDAPTSEAVVAAAKFGDELVARFTYSWRKVELTGVTSAPFRWQLIQTAGRATAPYSGVSMDTGVAVLCENGIEIYDGYQVRRLDLPKMRDISEEFTDTDAEESYGFYDQPMKAVYWTIMKS